MFVFASFFLPIATICLTVGVLLYRRKRFDESIKLSLVGFAAIALAGVVVLI